MRAAIEVGLPLGNDSPEPPPDQKSTNRCAAECSSPWRVGSHRASDCDDVLHRPLLACHRSTPEHHRLVGDNAGAPIFGYIVASFSATAAHK